MKTRLWDKGTALNTVVHDFTVGSDPTVDLMFIRWDIIASLVHAEGLVKIGVLTATELGQLRSALNQLVVLVDDNQFLIPRELEDCHTAIEAYLVEKLGEVGKKIHTGRSRNDQVLVATRLFLKATLLGALQDLFLLADAFKTRIDRDGALPMPGYTHFQRAMPSSVGMWLQSFLEWILELIKHGSALLDLIDASPLGAASGFGVPLALDRAFTAKRLGFSRVQRNPMYVQSSRGRFELQSLRWIADIGSLVEKLSCDLMLFTTAEYDFCSLPESLTTGSSIMPQKRNPDVVELLRASASKLRASEQEVSTIIAKLPSSYHRDLQFTKEPLTRASLHLDMVLAVVVEVINGVAFNTEKLKAAMSDDLFATYQVYKEVREGKSFRDAYRSVATNLSDPKSTFQEVRNDYVLIENELKSEYASLKKDLDSAFKEHSERAARFQEIEKVLKG